MKLGSNDPCWCKSGKKYKKCHMAFDEKLESYKLKGELVPDRELIKSAEQIAGIRESGVINTWLLDLLAEQVKPGVSTEELNRFIHQKTISKNAVPAPLNYRGFPKSICTSINQVVCHGIPSEQEILKDGDIVNIDLTTIYNGYFADASRMFCVGNVDEEAQRLVRVARECMEVGVQAVRPWGHLGDIGAAVSAHAAANGYTVVEDIGGHGTGLEFHEDPYVCHIGSAGEGMVLAPGMVFTVEPMINQGTNEFYTDEENGWTVYTSDGKLSAQWEHTIVVTESGIEILT